MYIPVKLKETDDDQIPASIYKSHRGYFITEFNILETVIEYPRLIVLIRGYEIYIILQ